MYVLKLHGIKHQLTSRQLYQGDDGATEQTDDSNRKTSDTAALIRKQHSVREPKSQPSKDAAAAGAEPLWRRRHSLAAAAKNTEWAQYYLSTAATDDAIAGFLSFKTPTGVHAEYFFNFVPKAVHAQDIVYKELLAVYNALRFWSGGKAGPLHGKHILLALFNDDAEKLMKAAKVKGAVGPEKMLIIKEINELCTRTEVQIRVAETAGDVSETAVFALVRSQQNAEQKKRFGAILQQYNQRNTDEPFFAKEKIFPPTYII